MKHNKIAIEVKDLFNRLWSDSDDFQIDDALGLDIQSPDDDTFDRYDAEITAWLDAHAGQYVEVTWPGHVSNPRFNSDASYALVGSRDQVDPQAVFYGN